MNKEEFCARFVAEMKRAAGFEAFTDGTTVEDYAKATAPSYYDEPDQRADGPEECARADVSYWGE